MDRCPDGIVACWIQTGMNYCFFPQSVFAWVLDSILIVAVVISMPWCLRCMREYWQELQERVKAEEALRREEKLRDYQMGSLIRESEEWCVDPQDLKSLWARQKHMRRLRDQSQLYQAVALLPMVVLMLMGMCSLPFTALRETAAFGNVMAIFGTGAILWCVWCQVQSFRGLAKIKTLARLSRQ